MPFSRQMERPDFSNREAYEAAGWERVELYDLGDDFSENKVSAFGALDLQEKIATFTIYKNGELGHVAFTLDFFDQGVVYTQWWLKNDKVKENFYNVGSALKMNENLWRIKKEKENIDLTSETKIIDGKEIVTAIEISFFQWIMGSKIITASVKITRKPRI